MLEDTLKKLADNNQTLSHKLLRGLSGLDRSSLAAVRQVWPSIDADRRRHITQSLVDMAENETEMDFVDLFRQLLSDDDAEVRAAATGGLWESDDERLVDPLINLLQTDPSSKVRAKAAETLGHFGAMGAEERLHGGREKRLLDALLQAFHEHDATDTVEVRRQALESAAFFSDDEQVIEAIREAHASPVLALRAGALGAMGLSFDAAWEDEVQAELSSPEPELRYEAAQACGLLWMEGAVPKLADMVRDPDQEVRLMAIWSLGEIGGKQAKDTLSSLLQSNNEAVREAAEEALDDLRFNEDPLAFGDMFEQSRGKKPKKP